METRRPEDRRRAPGGAEGLRAGADPVPERPENGLDGRLENGFAGPK